MGATMLTTLSTKREDHMVKHIKTRRAQTTQYRVERARSRNVNRYVHFALTVRALGEALAAHEALLRVAEGALTGAQRTEAERLLREAERL
jgi:hypothetical protein